MYTKKYINVEVFELERCISEKCNCEIDLTFEEDTGYNLLIGGTVYCPNKRQNEYIETFVEYTEVYELLSSLLEVKIVCISLSDDNLTVEMEYTG